MTTVKNNILYVVLPQRNDTYLREEYANYSDLITIQYTHALEQHTVLHKYSTIMRWWKIQFKNPLVMHILFVSHLMEDCLIRQENALCSVCCGHQCVLRMKWEDRMATSSQQGTQWPMESPNCSQLGDKFLQSPASCLLVSPPFTLYKHIHLTLLKVKKIFKMLLLHEGDVCKHCCRTNFVLNTNSKSRVEMTFRTDCLRNSAGPCYCF